MIVKANYMGRSQLPRRAVVEDAEMRSTLRRARVTPSRDGAVSQTEMDVLFETAAEQGLVELADKLGRLVSAKDGYSLFPWTRRPPVKEPEQELESVN